MLQASSITICGIGRFQMIVQITCDLAYCVILEFCAKPAALLKIRFLPRRKGMPLQDGAPI